MGLDWLAGDRPAPGTDPELYWALLLQALEDPDDPTRVALWRMMESVPSFDALNAPVVGRDAEATLWAVRRIRELPADAAVDLTSLTAEEREILARHHGYRVLELSPPCDGLPVYSRAADDPTLERTSFDATGLLQATDVLDDDLLERAQMRMFPEDLVDYGELLLTRARAYALQHDCPEAEHVRERPAQPLPAACAQAHVVFAAAKWCLYWGTRSHWLDISL